MGSLKAGFHEQWSWGRSRSRERPYDLVKIGVVSRVISSTESELEESEHFHSSNSVYDSVTYDSVKTRLS